MAISKLILNGVTQMDLTTDTVTNSAHIMSGYIGHLADGTQVTGTGQGGGGSSTPSATQHTIHLGFSDSTSTDINVYYNDTLLNTMITAYKPKTYGLKTVTLAQLDNVTWYEPVNIPIGTELIDYSKVTRDYAINSSGEVVAQEYFLVSDYTPVESGMTFTYTGCLWFYLNVYDDTKTLLNTIYISNDATVDENDSNTGHGTLSGSELPVNAAYVRITATGASSQYLSLIRMA